MKKQMKTPTGTRSSFARLFAVAALTTGSFSLVQAQDTAAKPAPAEIKYAGTSQDQILFEVNYSNETQNPFVVEVRDGEGYVFYTSQFKDKKFKKFFAIDKGEVFRSSLIISVATKGTVQKQVFDITTTTKTVDEVSVVKL